MRTKTPIRPRMPDLLSYVTVGAAVAFVFALTFGAFDRPDADHRVASNIEVPATSTP